MRGKGVENYKRKKAGSRVQSNVILVLCCGETEVAYFKQFNLDLGKIRLIALKENCCPEEMVRVAISKKTEGGYRQIWCVFDKDEFPDFNNAIYLAESHGIGTAFSNQAFELWFIMHFRPCNGPLRRDRYVDEINSLFKRDSSNKYEKPYRELYSKLKNKIYQAVDNAKVGHQNHIKNGGQPSDWESCTTVYKLVSELLKWKK